MERREFEDWWHENLSKVLRSESERSGRRDAWTAFVRALARECMLEGHDTGGQTGFASIHHIPAEKREAFMAGFVLIFNDAGGL